MKYDWNIQLYYKSNKHIWMYIWIYHQLAQLASYEPVTVILNIIHFDVEKSLKSLTYKEFCLVYIIVCKPFILVFFNKKGLN